MGCYMTDLLIAGTGLIAGVLLYMMIRRRKGRCVSCEGCSFARGCAFKNREREEEKRE